MPRVNTRVKSSRGKPYTCSTCGKPIEPGESFYYWSFRYGGTRRIHRHHGYPRQSQLTQSRMSDVYAAIENVEDIIGADDWALADAQGAVEELQGVVDEVVEGYREAAEHFGGQGENADRADELESYRDELDNLDLSEWEDAESRAESGEAKPCEECSGSGRVKCDNCDGGGRVSSGVLVPVVVDGRRDDIEEMVHCDVCSGEGDVECPECNGSGEAPEDAEDADWRENAKAHVEEIIQGAP